MNLKQYPVPVPTPFSAPMFTRGRLPREPFTASGHTPIGCGVIFLFCVLLTLMLTGCGTNDLSQASGSHGTDIAWSDTTASDVLLPDGVPASAASSDVASPGSASHASGTAPADPASRAPGAASPGSASHASGTAPADPAYRASGADSPGSVPHASGTAPADPASRAPGAAPSGAFTALHGALSVDGADLVDQNGDPVRLYGMSTHGIAWFPQYVSYDTFRTLRDDWDTNCIRLALYSDEYNGYSSGGNQEELKSLVKNGIDYATDLGMYVIVDWHVLHDQDPNVHKEDAIAFFREISSLYGDHTNILYEICNEPNGYATWDSVKAYAGEVIPVIRENDDDAVILVGSPTWSQNIDQAASSPLEFDNVMYTLHFYAATHTDDLRSRLETCASGGLPIFVSEFGMCDASGNGGNNFDQAEKWMELLDKYNISFMCWNLANKAETSSVLNSGCGKTADWTDDDLSESGLWIRERFRDVSAGAS